jgi:hypothetical protein
MKIGLRSDIEKLEIKSVVVQIRDHQCIVMITEYKTSIKQTERERERERETNRRAELTLPFVAESA